MPPTNTLLGMRVPNLGACDDPGVGVTDNGEVSPDDV